MTIDKARTILERLRLGRIDKKETAHEPKTNTLGQAYNEEGYGKADNNKPAMAIAS
jgi:hypothetical protein